MVHGAHGAQAGAKESPLGPIELRRVAGQLVASCALGQRLQPPAPLPPITAVPAPITR